MAELLFRVGMRALTSTLFWGCCFYAVLCRTTTGQRPVPRRAHRQASLEYAVNHLKVKVVCVLGHEGCGAVKAAGQPAEALQEQPAQLAQMLTMIKGGLEEDRLAHIKDPRARDREAVVTHVRRQLEKLNKHELFVNAVDNGELIVIGAFYEISSGIVDFFY